MGVSPLRYRLQLAEDGQDVIPRVQLSPIELSSAKFLQTVAIITTIIGGLGSGIGGIVSATADGPQAWQAAQDYYFPAIAEFLDAGGEAVASTKRALKAQAQAPVKPTSFSTARVLSAFAITRLPS